MKTGRYSLKDLLTHNEIEQIIIPEIQRDYVWKENNVLKLLQSISKHYAKKEKTTIEVSVLGENIQEESIINYLQSEYEKLKYNLKIGFVYAYHDAEYAGKFFLIDGQQRLTTLNLLLLALYKECGEQEDYINYYFKNEHLKIDYKVREASHDFFYEFVTNEVSLVNTSIKDNIRYYKSEYEKDETIKNLEKNYSLITRYIKENDWNKEHLDYVENFIELNYFDTHLSEQGEQLYIYMNSRGESLSCQEILRSAIVNKEVDYKKKKAIGEKWEDIQNYFWVNKCFQENADIGLEEFLKWATVIDICISENPDIKKKILNEKEQTLREAKENYIHRIQNRLSEQKEWLIDYQTKYLTDKHLTELFSALQILIQLKDKLPSIPIDRTWLSNNIITLDYLVLLPLLYFIQESTWENDQQKEMDVTRLTMFLQNLRYFESVKKNPDNYSIVAIELVKELCDAGQTDIIYLRNLGKYTGVLNEAEKYKLTEYAKPKSLRNELEKLVWGLTENQKLSTFLEGDMSIIFNYYNNKISYDSVNGVYSHNDIIELENLLQIFEKGIFEHKDSDLLKRALLTYGDYLLDHDHGSDHFGPWIRRYSFIQNDEQWREFFNECHIEEGETKPIIFKFLDDLVSTSSQVAFSFKNHYSSLITQYSNDDWKEAFIKEDALLEYCTAKRILWESEKRIILLLSIRANNAREIQCQLLKQMYPDYSFWIHGYNTCVFDFSYNTGTNKLEYNEQKEDYAIDLKHEGGQWLFSLLHRDEAKSSNKLQPFLANGWIQDNASGVLKVMKGNNPLYVDDVNKSIIDNIKAVEPELESLIGEIIKILK